MISKCKSISLAVRVILAGGLVAAGLELALLIDPSQPERSAYLDFDGYITLPRERLLSVMDYLSMNADDLYVASPSSGSLFRIELNRAETARARQIAVLPGGDGAHGLAVAPSGKRGFISRSGTNSVDVVDLADMRMTKRIPVAPDPDAILLDPASGLVYVASGDSGVITLIDPAKEEVVASIALDGKPEYAVIDEENDLIYQNIKDRGMLAVIDPRRRTLVESRPLSGCLRPTGLAIDPRYPDLFVNCGGNGRLIVLAMDGGQIIASIPIAPHADSVAFDALYGRLYTTGRDGELSIIQQDGPRRYFLLDRIATHYGAHTLTVDPKTHRIYLAYASLLVAPRIAVFTPEKASIRNGAGD